MAVITPPWLPRALYFRGVAMSWAGDPESALPILHDALALARDSADARFIVTISTNVGHALYDLHRFDDALTYYRQAFDESIRVLGDRELVAKLAVDIGHVYLVKNDVDLALRYYERAREFTEDLGDFRRLGSTYSGLSYAYHIKGDTTLAVQYGRLSVAAFDRAGDERTAAGDCGTLAFRLLEAGLADEAESTAREAITRSQAAISPDFEAGGRAALAAVHLHRGDLDSARVEAEIAVALAPDMDAEGRFDAWTVLAEIAERRGDHGETDAFYQRALDGFKRAGIYTRYSEVVVAYSQLLRNRGDTERAMEYALLATGVPSPEAG
jgi:tetratricopeptide (TPR) repeat protein